MSRLDDEPTLSLAIVDLPDELADQPQATSIDWDTLQIVEREDDEGRLEIIDDNQLYELLGLRAEDEAAERCSEDAKKANNAAAMDDTSPVDDPFGAAIPIDDDIPGERLMVYDPNNPSMDLGAVYPSMAEFRLAMRQFAINEEFELQVVKTDPSRFIGDCKGEDCPWHIVGRRQPDGKTVMVLTILFLFLYVVKMI